MSKCIAASTATNSDVVVYIGRFSPAHLGHLSVIKKGLEIGKYMIILIGSCQRPRSPTLPWDFNERKEMLELMIRNNFSKEDAERVIITGIRDKKYNDNAWVKQVQDVVDVTIKTCLLSLMDDPSVRLIGHFKDESSYYLDLFPQWDYIEIPNWNGVSATTIREWYFNQDKTYGETKKFLLSVLDEQVNNYLENFAARPEYDYVLKEFEYYRNYEEAWKNTPYKVIFHTTDAVVVKAGHILLVRRRAVPGKGLWALPGGFVDQNETLVNGMLRELEEETKIDVPKRVLQGSIKKKEDFDDPKRSLRGRTITKAYLIDLNNDGFVNLPKVKGSDDAEKAKWIPLSQLESIEPMLFEDHFHIIKNMLGIE